MLINIVNSWFCLTDLLVALVRYVIKALSFCIHISDDHCLLLDLRDGHHFSNVPNKEL